MLTKICRSRGRLRIASIDWSSRTPISSSRVKIATNWPVRKLSDRARSNTALRSSVASANHRLQAELDENARLRKELEEARAKLDAIANIERSLNERKPGNSGR